MDEHEFGSSPFLVQQLLLHGNKFDYRGFVVKRNKNKNTTFRQVCEENNDRKVQKKINVRYIRVDAT